MTPLFGFSSLTLLSLTQTNEINFEQLMNQVAEKKNNYLDIRKNPIKQGLSNHLTQYADSLNQNPLLKNHIQQLPGGNSLIEGLAEAKNQGLSTDSVKKIQSFLYQMGIDISYPGNTMGVDGKYGPRTHMALQSFFGSILNSQSEATPEPSVNFPTITDNQTTRLFGESFDPQQLDFPVPVQTSISSTTSHNRGQIREWQQLAGDMVSGRHRGVDKHRQDAPIYEGLLEQVTNQTQPISVSQDRLRHRQVSMRPRLGQGFRLNQGKIYDAQGQQARAAAVIFDRDNNLFTALNQQGDVILAVEARNNTRQHFTGKSDRWLKNNSVVSGSNAPAPNGIYAVEDIFRQSPRGGKSFGSNKINVAGGMMDDRLIRIHSRDYRTNKEIPWSVNRNTSNSRTLGCILVQDADLQLMGDLIRQSSSAVAVVVQGSYAKNLASPQVA